MKIDVKYNEKGLAPAVCRDRETGEVLMLAWMNREALALTIESGEAHFWSRSRGELWHKGATSGNFLKVDSIRVDCDADALVLDVIPAGPACHTGEQSCFHRDLNAERASQEVNLGWLQRIIRDRLFAPEAESYTARLIAGPVDKLLQKVGEEAVEVIVAAVSQGRERLIEETADLFYHVLVLLARERVSLEEVYSELARRHDQKIP